jgi:hypothetical protein
MAINAEVFDSQSTIIVTAHDDRDAKFYGQWLLSAAELGNALDSLMRSEPEFRDAYLSRIDLWESHPCHVATNLAAKLIDGDGQLDLESEAPELVPGFCALSALGLFSLRDDLASMSLPTEVDPTAVKKVFVALSIIPDESWTDPAQVVTTLNSAR